MEDHGMVEAFQGMEKELPFTIFNPLLNVGIFLLNYYFFQESLMPDIKIMAENCLRAGFK